MRPRHLLVGLLAWVLLSVGGFAVNAGVAVAEERQASVPSASSTYESTAYAYDEFAGAYDAAAYTYDGSAGLSSPHATAVAERGSPTRPAAVWLGWSVVADGVVDAAEGAGGGSRPFVMGIKDHLDEFAATHGGETWKSLPEAQLGGDAWKSGVTRMLEDPNKRVLFNLDGVDVWPGVTRAASGRGGATDWELLQIRSNSYPNLEFWQNGQRVGNPFG